MKAVDHHVLDHEFAGQQMDRQAADAHGPFHIFRSLVLGGAAHGRTKIHGHRRHDGGREKRGRQHHADACVTGRLLRGGTADEVDDSH